MDRLLRTLSETSITIAGAATIKTGDNTDTPFVSSVYTIIDLDEVSTYEEEHPSDPQA